jgi:hypothetical protein
MARSYTFLRIVLVVGAGSLCISAGGDKNATEFQIPLTQISTRSQNPLETFQDVKRSTAESFNAKSPKGGTVCTWVGPPTGNWEDAASWSCGHVPMSTNDVEIFVGTVTLNSVADVHSIIIGNGAGLTVATGQSLNINH